MQPIRDNILIIPCESDSVSDGGIIVPDSVKLRSNKAKVVAAGNMSKRKSGDIIFHVKGAGHEIIIDDVKHYLIKEMDCLAYN